MWPFVTGFFYLCNVFQVHLHCGTCQLVSPFHGCILSYSKNGPHFIYSFISPWTFGFFIIFWPLRSVVHSNRISTVAFQIRPLPGILLRRDSWWLSQKPLEGPQGWKPSSKQVPFAHHGGQILTGFKPVMVWRWPTLKAKVSPAGNLPGDLIIFHWSVEVGLLTF